MSSRSLLAAMAYNVIIVTTKNKTMKATALGIWYVQSPLQYVINPQGEVVEVKEHNGSLFVWINRKRKPVSKITKLDYQQAMQFKNIFCLENN